MKTSLEEVTAAAGTLYLLAQAHASQSTPPKDGFYVASAELVAVADPGSSKFASGTVETSAVNLEALEVNCDGALIVRRTINEHHVGSGKNELSINVLDEPGQGGACHVYMIEHPQYFTPVPIEFQNGPIAERGVNGITHEVLLAIVADRLRSFQKGPFGCKANACALTHIEEALHWLQQRTLERMRRGVEGTNTI